jgi:hypothetical protein
LHKSTVPGTAGLPERPSQARLDQADEDSVGEVFGLAQGLASLLGLLSIGLYTATSIIDLRLPFVVFAIPLVMAWFLVARLNTPETAKTAEAA